MAGFQLHLITERLGATEAWRPRVLAAAEGGVDWIQLRDRSAAALDLLQAARDLRQFLGPGARVQLSINDRVDVALAVPADGVHLAGRSLPVREARALTGARLLVGRSVHGLEEALEAAAAGADYLTFGHVYPSASKPGLPPRGAAQLGEIVQAVDVPVLGIGGITAANLSEVLATGCAGIAVISAVLGAVDPCQAACELRRALDNSPHQPRFPFPSRIAHLEDS